MPRTGGVYSPPAGTKGTPNTTIQSVPYNTFIDDLTADANAARPITAGGTGATSASGARTALGVAIGSDVQAYDASLQSIAGLTTVADRMIYTTAPDVYATTALTPFARTFLDDTDAATVRATIGANDASNLTTGTVADARLPASQSGKTWTSFSNFNAAAIVSIGDAVTNTNYWSWRPTDYGVGKPALNIRKTTTATTWQIELFDTVTNAGTINFQCTGLTLNGNTIWNSANDGAASGLDADLLDGQHGSFYQNATNLNAGTVADVRLPASMAGKTFTSNVNFGAGTSVVDGDAFLTLNGDRPWVFRQRGEDTTASLSIENNSNKSIGFSCDNTYAGAVIVINPLTSSPSITVLGNTVWHAGNDGSGSGLDADLLDGQDGSFYRNASNINAGTLADARLPGTMSSKTFTGNVHMTGPNGSIEVGAVGASNTPSVDFHSSASSTDFDARLLASGGTAASGAGNLDVISAAFTKGGNTIWHAGNDGAGSGLDADLLDGQQGSYYADIPSRLGFTPVQQGGGTSMGTNKIYLGWGTSGGLRAQVDATPLGFVWTDNAAGGAPSSGWVKFPSGLILQSGSTVVTTNASADGSISFPNAFPTACLSVVGVGGDVTVPSTDLKIGGLTTTAFNFRAPGAASQSVRVNWIAWGY